MGACTTFVAEGYIAIEADGVWSVAECEHTETTTTNTATCTEAGVNTVTCNACGEVVSTEAVAALGHTELVEKEAAEAPTCTTDGKTAVMGCERCDYTEGGEVDPATGHVNTTESTTEPTREADAVKTVTCNDCGEVVSTETIAPTEVTIKFNHNVRFEAEYFLMFAPNHSTENSWIEFTTYNYDTAGNVVENVTIIDERDYTTTAERTVFLSPGIPAKQMNDKIEAVYYYIEDGVKYKSQVDTYNLVDYYLSRANNTSTDPNLKTLLVEMLNYGAAAQKQLKNYNVTEVEGDRYRGLVNLHLPEEQRRVYPDSVDLDAYADVTTSTGKTIHGDTAGMAYTYQANNGRFEQRISVLVAFKPVNGAPENFDNLVFKGTYTGLDSNNKNYIEKQVEIKGAEGGFEFITISGVKCVAIVIDQIPVKDLRAVVKNAAIYDLDGNRVSETVDVGFECYVHDYSGSTATMKLLMKATLAYADAAKTYFINK